MLHVLRSVKGEMFLIGFQLPCVRKSGHAAQMFPPAGGMNVNRSFH
jgi:hypothetical protein